jgi:hypothetical protein
MRKAIGLALFLLGATSVLLAQPGAPAAPEIDPGSAGTAIALLSGTLLMIRGRRRKN